MRRCQHETTEAGDTSMSTTDRSVKKPRGGFGEFVSTIIQALVIALLVQMFVFQSFYIPSGSMKPTLDVGDFLFVDKFAYGYSRYSFSYGVFGLQNGIIPFNGRIIEKAPKRGDIVVFRQPNSNGIDFIKRVIGLPGDKIQMQAGVLSINGTPVPRVYDAEFNDTDDTGEQVSGKEYTETLPNGVSYHVWKMTDAGGANNTPVYQVPPDRYFMMGDNRDNSEDSRFLEAVGYVPFQNLIGKARLVYFSHTGIGPTWGILTGQSAVRWDRIFKPL
jgi:signal peptidase I